jgi:hypothetical protein
MKKDVFRYNKLLFLILCIFFSEYQLSAQSLDEGFKNPPVSARPRAYLDFLNGNFNLTQISYELYIAFTIWKTILLKCTTFQKNLKMQK